jgi:hypothetical protein
MENALIVITVVSSAIALAMTAFVVRMLRDERRRSDARVEALVRLASSGFAATIEPTVDPTIAERESDCAREGFNAAALHDEVEAEPAAVVDERMPVAGVGGLFAEPEHASPWARRLGIAASLAILAGIVGFGVSSFGRGSDARARVEAAPAQTDAVVHLELLSMTHEHRGDSLTIAGVVQNPKSNQSPVTGVQAAAVLFAADGSVVATGGAPIDFSRLRPGDESPFVLRVPARGSVARYRIGFRGEDGHVIGHVDRRAGGPLARNE